VPTFKLTVAYDGTGLVGWQRQANGASVQQAIEEALADLAGGPVAVAGAGRTDAGVHALAQVASCTIERPLDAATIVRAANARLPAAIRILGAEEAPPTFHARFGARTKTYQYRLWNGDVLDPFERAFAWHVPGRLDVAAMAEAARVIEGRQDFAAFQAAGGVARSTEREVIRSEVARRAEALVTYEVCGNGFLRHMVRAIVGSLVEIGRGRRDPAWLASVVASRDRTLAGPTAPAQGLFLVRVDYSAKE
jgi:tRNA pseudouridine38-40 synthase